MVKSIHETDKVGLNKRNNLFLKVYTFYILTTKLRTSYVPRLLFINTDKKKKQCFSNNRII